MSVAGKKFELQADCPRCGTQRITFDVLQDSFVPGDDWSSILFCRCRSCFSSVNFEVTYNRKETLSALQGSGFFLNALFNSVVLQKPTFANTCRCPEYTPDHIERAFNEATLCLSVGAWNGSGALFRKTVDLTTRTLVPQDDEHRIGENGYISWKTFKDLRLRIDWLLDKSILDRRLAPLIDCIREDGNDAAHASENLDRDACLDLQDFTVAVLESVFTEPGRIAESVRRRIERRGN